MNWSERFLRPGLEGRKEVRRDLLWLFVLCLVTIATGVGLRDPWPADEPRFALIARDMLATGDWLIPQVGGDLYADKPPLFFWIVAFFTAFTDSVSVGVLLPGFAAGVGVVLLTYDLARRLWDRTAAFAAGLALLATVQFVWQARQGQIDATLCFFTTLGLYGLLRHLLLGPAWGWYVVGWAAAGLGVITKGVGFLPVLVLIPYAYARARAWRSVSAPGGAGVRWLLGPLAMIAAISIWLAPMLIAAAGNPQLAEYRDEILFSQTIERYADAWHHGEPVWYFLVQVIPVLWLPLAALLPWLWPRWRQSWRDQDGRVWLPLAWAVIVVLFFSLSSGKRGVYILPAIPGFVAACAPFLPELSNHRGPRKTLFGVACAVALLAFAAAAYAKIEPARRAEIATTYDLDVLGPLLAIAIASAAACIALRPRHGFAAYGAVLACVLLVVSFWVNPAMNDARSGARFMQEVERRAPAEKELGVVGYKEQYLLQASRPLVNFGHARWREYDQEAADAAAWLGAAPDRRVLLVDDRARELCFSSATAEEVGVANRLRWFLVSGSAEPQCVARGEPKAARRYAPASTAE